MTQSFEERLRDKFYKDSLINIDGEQCTLRSRRESDEIANYFIKEIELARKEEWKRCVDLLDRDHSKCPIKETCIGYMNAQSDLVNNPPEEIQNDKRTSR